MYKNCMKRLLDLIGSIILLPVGCLVVIVFAPFIYFEDRGSIFYLAKRRGLNGKIFNMFKLRSMSMNAPDIRNKDNSTYNAPDDPRVTRIGRLMRKTSVDELPQVFNIIKGDMSFIGPRPITTDKPMSEYDEKRRIRLTVRPGITGYSQAYYRNAISQEEKLQNDSWYAQHVSFTLDVKIFFKTIQTVLLRKNVYKS